MPIPTTMEDFFICVAQETARMSYPGSMSRGHNPVVTAGTKILVENYFVEQFPFNQIWDQDIAIVNNFDAWHFGQSQLIAGIIEKHVPNNLPSAVATKFLNTFLHQLIKYEQARWLLPKLHLPLDRRVFRKLRYIADRGVADLPEIGNILHPVRGCLNKSPYQINYESYILIKNTLFNFMQALNGRGNAEFVMNSRTDLNWLWI